MDGEVVSCLWHSFFFFTKDVLNFLQSLSISMKER
jgi:hypothetical protein